MKWQKIDPNKIESLGEVLAANFKLNTYGYREKLIGYLHVNNHGVVCCENEHEILENVTHYIDMSRFDVLS